VTVGRFCGGCRQVLCILGAFPAICGGFRRICAGLECFRRSVVLSARLAVGDLGLLVDSVVAVGDLGLSEGSGVWLSVIWVVGRFWGGCWNFFLLLIAGVTKVLV
jgi:hypothetical protein